MTPLRCCAPPEHDLWPRPRSQCDSNPATRGIHFDPERESEPEFRAQEPYSGARVRHAVRKCAGAVDTAAGFPDADIRMIRLGSRAESKCEACNGTRFPPVKQPSQPGRRIILRPPGRAAPSFHLTGFHHVLGSIFEERWFTRWLVALLLPLSPRPEAFRRRSRLPEVRLCT